MSSVVLLGGLCDFIRGVTFDKANATTYPRPGAIPILRAGNIQRELNTSTDLVWLPEAGVAGIQKLRKNDVAICMSSGSSEIVGKTARVRNDFNGSVGSFCGIIRPKKEKYATLIAYFFQSELFKKYRDGIARGANIQNLRFSQFEGIPLTSPHEPEAIANILTNAGHLRRTRRYAQQLSDTFLQSVFLEMFGDPAKNDLGWDEGQIEDYCTFVRGSSPRPQGDPQYFGGPVPRLMIADITRDGIHVTPRIDSLTELGATKSRFMNAGSVAMAVSGAVGLAAVLNVDACIHDGFVGFRDLDEQISPLFLVYLLRAMQSSYSSQASGAIWKNLTTDQVNAWKIPLPPQHLVNRFLEIATRMDRLQGQQRETTRQAEHLFQTLLHQAFRGDL